MYSIFKLRSFSQFYYITVKEVDADEPVKKKPRFRFDNDSKGFSVFMSRKLEQEEGLQGEEREEEEKQREKVGEKEENKEVWGSHFIDVFKFRYSLSSPIAPPYPLSPPLVTSHVKN